MQGDNDLKRIARQRLLNQHLLKNNFQAPADLVAHMGAMQAQDYPMSKWAVGCRVLNSTEHYVTAALNKAEIIRTHLMRPTWHLVSSKDIYWMLELSAPNIMAGLKGRHRDLELTEPFLQKTNQLLIRALEGNKHLTRDEIAEIMKAEKIQLDNNRLAHILMNAELDALICNGADRGKITTYSLLSERVPEKKTLTKDEALFTLASKYFKSHGPATLPDFQWWSGLRVKDAKDALELVKSVLYSETMGEEVYWSGSEWNTTAITDSVFLLPAYDEYTISYKNREAVLLAEYQSKALSANGVFWPIVVVNGKVVGIWKRTIKNTKVEFIFDLFGKANQSLTKQLEEAALKFSNFIGKEAKFV